MNPRCEVIEVFDPAVVCTISPASGEIVKASLMAMKKCRHLPHEGRPSAGPKTIDGLGDEDQGVDRDGGAAREAQNIERLRAEQALDPDQERGGKPRDPAYRFPGSKLS